MDSGTRLGWNGPKGTFLVNVEPEPKYIFEILADNLKRANKKYKTTIPWYIMVSRENKEQTISFFEDKQYFEYPQDKVKFFTQGEMPLLDENKQFLYGKDGKVKFAADGNGSIYRSMKENGILQDMKDKRIEWIYICSVDNILLKMAEPVLLGLTIKQGNQVASKTIIKNSPEEKVGVFCIRDGKPCAIEYSELPKEMAEPTNEEGELIFGEAHIMCNLFSLSAIEKIAQTTLPYHVAHKKVNYYVNGEEIIPKEPNAYKFEQFIFDSFPLFENITLLRGKREEDFAPVKNKEGQDSPKTAIELYNKYWKNKQ